MTPKLKRALDHFRVLKDARALTGSSPWQRRILGLDGLIPGAAPRAVAVRTSGDQVRLDWDGGAYPGVLVLDATTGGYLASLTPEAREFRCGPVKALELRLSDGLHSSVLTVPVQ
jgi:hypothetical protein